MIKLNLVTLLSILVVLICPLIGGESLFSFIDLQGGEKEIFWQLRVPRANLGFVVGASLAVAGAIFQTIFKNPLASPYTLGVASAGSLGACLAIVFHGNLLICSIGFSVLASFLLLSYRGNSNNLLLLGVALGLLFSSASIFLSYLSDPMQNYQLTRWLMGGLDVASNKQLLLLNSLFCIVFVICFKSRQEFDLLLTGDDLALTKGLDVKSFKGKIVFILSLLIGIVVSLAGPIGFVGILVPHLCRSLGANNHHILLSRIVFIGGGLLVFSDYLARTIVYPAEIPVGVITALFGAPIFIYVLLKAKC
jgi:iron complex transport system permease protein